MVNAKICWMGRTAIVVIEVLLRGHDAVQEFLVDCQRRDCRQQPAVAEHALTNVETRRPANEHARRRTDFLIENKH